MAAVWTPNMKPASDTKFILFQPADGSRRMLFGCFGVFVSFRLFLVVLLLSYCAEASEESASVKIVASAGQTIILPCSISVSDEVPTVEWSKEGLNPNFAFLYRQGCETFEEKNPHFHYRTNLIMKELKNGNISLRLSDVQLSDAGTYICKTIQRKLQEIAKIELFVGAVSEPKLSVVPAAGVGVTLQCDANCWFPKPEITFLDAQRNTISAENPKFDLDFRRGCFNVTRRATVQTNRVTCRVHQPKINETRAAEIYIPDDCMMSCTLRTSIGVIVTIIVCGLFCALTVFLCKKRSDSVGGDKLLFTQSSHQSSTRSNAEGPNLTNQADPTGNASTEHLIEINELKLKLREKEETICRLTEELKNLRSQQSPIVCQHGQPTIDSSPSKSSPDVSKPTNLPTDQFPHNNSPKPAASTNSNRPKSEDKGSKPVVSIQIPASSPSIQRGIHDLSSPDVVTNGAVSPSASSAFPSEAAHVFRSMSMSKSRPSPNGAKLQRRYTTASALYGKRLSAFSNVPEDDSEPLL